MIRNLHKITLLSLILVIGTNSYSHNADGDLTNLNITGFEEFGGDFEFLDNSGKLRNLSDFRNKVVSLFFGFTNCPDVCPAYLAKMTAVTDQLEDEAKNFQVIYITIDPQRDTRERLENYLSLFSRDFIGARIPNDKFNTVKKQYAMSSQFFTDKNGNVVVSHNTGSFLIDKNGVINSYIADGTAIEEYYEKISELL